MTRDEGGDDVGESWVEKAQHLNAPTVLRFAAFVLLVVGFVGIAETGIDPFSVDSPYSVAFLAGIACAVVSISLGIYGQGNDE